MGVTQLLVPGRVVTQDNYKTLSNLWARDYANVTFQGKYYRESKKT
jgi:hypothetical protein